MTRSMVPRARAILYTLAFAASSAMLSISPQASSANTTEEVQLDGHKFEIPERYFRQSRSIPDWLQWLPGLDDRSRELLLTIDATEVAAAVPGFKPMAERYVDDLRLRIVALRDYERQRYLRPSFLADIWNSSGSYHDRLVKQDNETGWFRVYRRIEYPNSWEVLTISPNEPLPTDIFSFWIGHCLEGTSTLTTSGTLALCKSYVLVDGVAVHFTMTEQNLETTDAVRSYLAKLVSEWLK